MKFLFEQDGTPCGVEIDGRVYTPEELAAIVAAQVSDGAANFSVRGAQTACRAVEEGAVCGLRTYAGRPYCKKHNMRFKRHGDPAIARRPWDLKKERV
jgi:hypothetical protein